MRGGRWSPSPDEGWRLTAEDVAPLARGAMILGSGGGGEVSVAALLAHRALEAASGVDVISPEALDPDATVVAVSVLGSPAILAERVPSGAELVTALRGLERHLGRRAAALYGSEYAGGNALVPLPVAAELGLPLLDLDGTGRAYQRLNTTVLHAHGLPAGPLALTGAGGELVLIDVPDAVRVEQLARRSLDALGGWCAAACFPATVAEVASAAVRGALRRALELGRSAAHARDARDLAARLGGQLFAAGRVFDVVRSGARGSALVEPAQDAGSTLRIEFETEYLLAALDGRIVGATPDLIVVVNGHTLAPIQCEDLRRGDPVGVIGLDGPPEWYAPEALALASPAAWGYGP